MKYTPNDVAQRVLQIREQLAIYEATARIHASGRDWRLLINTANEAQLLQAELDTLRRFEGSEI